MKASHAGDTANARPFTTGSGPGFYPWTGGPAAA
jgi:hypothetical protein